MFYVPMKPISLVLTACWLVAFSVAIGWSDTSEPEPQTGVVTIGGSVTEIAFALGQGHRVIARDTTSTFPANVRDLPDVGYMRALSPEGVLSVGPTLIISEEGSGPPEAIDVLNATSVPFVTVPDEYSRQGIVNKIKAVGAALNVDDRAEDLASDVNARLSAAEERAAAKADDPLRVMFILSLQGGRILASGQNTAAEAIIEMAGGVNAVQGFEGYKAITEEAATAAAPDAILMMARAGDHSADNDALFALPGLTTTPAAEADRVVRMDGLLLLGFGPRTAEAVELLSEELYTN